MARAAVPRRLTWRVATLLERRPQTPSAQTLRLRVPGWPGHAAGQHVDLRLTAPDGYSTQRSYSLASPATGDDVIELTVQRIPEGEVSPFLTGGYAVGDPIELRGPIGGWFLWEPGDSRPVNLIGGGSGVVPLMAMIRARRAARDRTAFRLLYSVRGPVDVLYPDELRMDHGVDTTVVYTREAPGQSRREAGRLTVADVNNACWPAEFEPLCFVCGPTGFVETAAAILVALGHRPGDVKTERFGGAQ
jgi:ferredoxin-NADP reductase